MPLHLVVVTLIPAELTMILGELTMILSALTVILGGLTAIFDAQTMILVVLPVILDALTMIFGGLTLILGTLTAILGELPVRNAGVKGRFPEKTLTFMEKSASFAGFALSDGSMGAECMVCEWRAEEEGSGNFGCGVFSPEG